MSSLRKLTTALAVGASVTFGGVSLKAQISGTNVTNEKVARPDASTFERLLATPSRFVEEDKASRALDELGLLSGGSKAFSWATRTGSGGTYVFTDVSAVDSDAVPFSFDRVKITGLRLESGHAVFDRIDLKGVSVQKDDNLITLDQLSLSDLPPEFSSAIARTIRDFDQPDVFDEQFEDRDVGIPGAVFIDNFYVNMDDDESRGTISLATLGWGKDGTTGKGHFLLRGFDMEVEDENFENPIEMSLGTVRAEGVDMDYFRDVIEAFDVEELDDNKFDRFSLMMYQDPYKKSYDRLEMADLRLRVDTLNLGLDQYIANVTKVGDVLTYRSEMRPLTLKFSGKSNDPEIQDLQNLMNEAGFEELSFTGGSTTVLNETYDRFEVTNSFLEFAGNARIRFDYAGKGLGSMMNALKDIENIEEASDAEAMAIFKDLSLDYLDISVTDMSLLDKIFAIAAQDANVTQDLMKTKAKAGLMMGAIMAETPSQMDFATQASSALVKFIDQGGTVNFKARPDIPISLTTLEDVDSSTFDPADFGLSISHSGE